MKQSHGGDYDDRERCLTTGKKIYFDRKRAVRESRAVNKRRGRKAHNGGTVVYLCPHSKKSNRDHYHIGRRSPKPRKKFLL